MLKKSWTEHKTNDEVLQLAEEQRTLMTTLRQRQIKWLGHLLHHDSLLKKVIEGQMKGRKKPGRLRELDWLMKKEHKLDYSQLKWMAEERLEWHR